MSALSEVLLQKAASLKDVVSDSFGAASVELAKSGVSDLRAEDLVKAASEVCPQIMHDLEFADFLEKTANYISDLEKYASEIEEQVTALKEMQAKIELEKKASENPGLRALAGAGFKEEEIRQFASLDDNSLNKLASAVKGQDFALGRSSELPNPNGSGYDHFVNFCMNS